MQQFSDNRNPNGWGRLVLVSLAIILFSVCYTLFMRMQLPAYGSRIGTYLDDISYAMVVALILHLIFCLPSVPRKICLLVFAGFLQLVLIGEWWHYEFYRDYIHYSSLAYLVNVEEGARGFGGFESRYLAMIGTAVFLLAAFGLERLASSANMSLNLRLLASLSMAVIAFIPTAVYTTFYVRSQITNWQMSEVIPLNYKNPVMQLLREKYIDKSEVADIRPMHVSAVDELYKKKNGQYPFYRNTTPGPVANKKNVLLITLESVREYETIARDGIELTPNLNAIAQTNFTPKFYYANSNQTIKAEIALLCGTHDFLIGTSISAGNNQQVKTNCLPSILKEYGYSAYWFHGAHSSFFNRNVFLPKIGFDELHDRDVIERSYIENEQPYKLRHWGVEDPYTFKYALATLENKQEPFIAEILTVSNHHPFIDLETSWDESDFHPGLPRNLDDVYNRYQHLIHYTDTALGEFWQAFKQSPLYENTVVVISGDHGIWVFPEQIEQFAGDRAALEYEAYLRLPLTIYFPGKTFKKPVDVTISQVDVPVLLLDYLGIDYPRAFQSKLGAKEVKQLLNGQPPEPEFHNPVFASIGDNFYYRHAGIACYPPIHTRDDCDDYLFRCVDDFNTLKTDKQCVSWQGDMLRQTPGTQPENIDTDTLNATVDYFRKALYFGSMPEQQVLQAEK